MSEFRIEYQRPLTVKKRIRGLDVHQPTGMCYVDCFFPNGSQGTYGYIGNDPAPGSVFAPLSHCTQEIANLIQGELNKALGSDGTAPPTIIEYVGNEPDEDDDE